MNKPFYFKLTSIKELNLSGFDKCETNVAID